MKENNNEEKRYKTNRVSVSTPRLVGQAGATAAADGSYIFHRASFPRYVAAYDGPVGSDNITF